MTIPWAQRTSCDCADCAAHCFKLPGAAAPEQIQELCAAIEAIGLDPLETLVQGKGMLLAALPNASGASLDVIRLATIRPRRLSDGRCVFLDADHRCRIHATSPFGCGFFDSHMGPSEADLLLRKWALSVLHAERGYRELWQKLRAGHEEVVPPAGGGSC